MMKSLILSTLLFLNAGLATAANMYHRKDEDYASCPKKRRKVYISLSINILPAAWYSPSLFEGAKTSKLIKTKNESKHSKKKEMKMRKIPPALILLPLLLLSGCIDKDMSNPLDPTDGIVSLPSPTF